MLVEAAKVVLNQFPYEEIEGYAVIYRPGKEFVDEEMIRDDFSSLSDSEIVANENIINDYYSDNLDYMVLDEIANNPGVYDAIGAQNQRLGKNAVNLMPAWRVSCILSSALADGYGLVRPAISYGLASWYAEKSLVDSDDSYFKSLPRDDSRRDAYRHMLWNSLLAQYYFTISSKSRRLSFAELIANANESSICGSTNNIDTREMDFHNNVIGRKIWSDNTGYRTIFGATIGLNRTSTSHLKGLALDKIEKEGLFIIKTHPSSHMNNKIYDYSSVETEALILQTDVNTPVYFVGPIAPVYETSLEQEYYNCNEGTTAAKSKSKDIILFGKAPIEDEEIGDCVRYVFVYTPIYQKYVTKDVNYNPYFRHNTNPFN